MKKLKQLSLLQTKEKLNQRKTISHLVGLKTEAEKCRKVGKELDEITKRKNNENQQKLLTYLSLRNQPIFSSDNEYNNRILNARHKNKRFTKKRKKLRGPSQSINTTRRF